MTTFNYEINIEATTEAEADTKMKAITVLVKKLKSTELAKLAHIVQNDRSCLHVSDGFAGCRSTFRRLWQ